MRPRARGCRGYVGTGGDGSRLGWIYVYISVCFGGGCRSAFTAGDSKRFMNVHGLCMVLRGIFHGYSKVFFFLALFQIKD